MTIVTYYVELFEQNKNRNITKEGCTLFQRIISIRNEDGIALCIKKIKFKIALLLFLFIKLIYH